MSYFDAVAPGTLPRGRRVAARQQLEQLVVQSAPRRRPGRRKKWVVPGAILLSVAAVACAAAVATYARITNRTQARCYTMDDVSSHYFVVGQAGTAGEPGDVRGAIAVCASLYQQGFLKAGRPTFIAHPDPRVSHGVPPLVACTLHDGSAGVFPGGPGTCARLGLPRALRLS